MLTLDQQFSHNGQSVAWGKIGDGPPIVLVHGFPWSAQAWRRIAPHLARSRTVYYFDMIGCGQSEKHAEQDVSPPVQSALLSALLTHWQLDRPEIVAHDFGGLAALRAYFLHGARYGKATLVDAVAVLPSGSPFFAHVREHEAAFAGLPPYAHEALFQAYIQNAAYRPMDGEARDIYAAPWRGPEGQPAFYRQIAHSGNAYISEVQELYAPLDCEVTLLWGEKDSFIPPQQGEELATLIQADRLLIAPDAGHILQEDAPEAVMAAILA